jgi:hypothetical protein
MMIFLGTYREIGYWMVIGEKIWEDDMLDVSGNKIMSDYNGPIFFDLLSE